MNDRRDFAEEKDVEVVSCQCSLIHPYHPTDDNQGFRWCDLSLDRGWFWYNDDRVESAFTQFLFRDHSALSVSIGSMIGYLLFPIAELTPMEPLVWWVYSLFLGLFWGGLAGADIFLHARRANDPSTPKYRQVIYVLYCFGCLLSMSFLSGRDHVSCYEGTVPLQCYLRPSLSLYSSQTLILVYSSLRVKPVWFLGVLPLHIILYMMGRLIFPLEPGGVPVTEPPADTAVKVIAYILLAIGSFIFNSFRFTVFRSQFEQAIRAEIATKDAQSKQEKVEVLLDTMAPQSVLSRLMEGPAAGTQLLIVDTTPCGSILFSDMVSFTAWSSKRTAKEVVAMLNILCIVVDDVANSVKGVDKICTIGDAYWAVSLPSLQLDTEEDEHADILVAFALQMQRLVMEMGKQNANNWGGATAVRLRIGIHSGPVAAALLGARQLSYQPFGLTNHIAEEVEKKGLSGRVVVSHDTAKFLKSFSVDETPVGSVEEHDHEWQLFAVSEDIAAVAAILGTEITSKFMSSEMARFSDQNSVASSQRSARTAKNQHTTANVTANEAIEREKRKAFVARQAARKQASKEENDEGSPKSLDMLDRILKGSENQPWYTMAFGDQDVEAEYLTFVLDKTSQLRFYSLLVYSILLLALYVLTLVQGIPDWPFQVLFWAGWLGSFAAVITCYTASGQRHGLETVLLCIGFPVIEVGLALIDRTQVRAIITNEIFFFYGIFTVFITMTSYIYPPIVTCALNLLIAYIPLTVISIAVDLGSIDTSAIFLFVCFLAVAFIVVIQQRLARQQFLEMWTAKHFQEQSTLQAQAREELLLTMVPRHVVQPLIAWIDSNLAATHSIAVPYDALCVGFFDFSETLEFQETGEDNLRNRGEAMCSLHTGVDLLLSTFPSLVKIKCIGEIVMVAGPFTGEVSVQECCLDILRFTKQCKTKGIELPEKQNVSFNAALLRAGFHVGPVMAAVLGTIRLTFDIFGDSVNTTSRAMTTAKSPGTITCTESFVNTLRQLTGEGEVGNICVLSEKRERTAKGKGQVFVYEVEQWLLKNGGEDEKFVPSPTKSNNFM